MPKNVKQFWALSFKTYLKNLHSPFLTVLVVLLNHKTKMPAFLLAFLIQRLTSSSLNR
jgi:hypothetical protein